MPNNLIFVVTRIVERPNGWWIEFTVDGQYVPERDIGPMKSKELAKYVDKDFENTIKSLGGLIEKGEA